METTVLVERMRGAETIVLESSSLAEEGHGGTTVTELCSVAGLLEQMP